MAEVYLKKVRDVLSTTISACNMNQRIVEMLTRLAIESQGVANGRVRMASGVVYKKHLIATGVNSYKSHPIMNGQGYRDGQIFLHAEMDAIKSSLRLITQDQLTKCDLYVVRVKRPHRLSKDWVHGLAKPCPGCTKAIANFGIKNIYWTEDEDLTISSKEHII